MLDQLVHVARNMVTNGTLCRINVLTAERCDNREVVCCRPFAILRPVQDGPQNLDRFAEESHLGLHESFRLRENSDFDVKSRVGTDAGARRIGIRHEPRDRFQSIDVTRGGAFRRKPHSGHAV